LRLLSTAPGRSYSVTVAHPAQDLDRLDHLLIDAGIQLARIYLYEHIG
jgi:hypothetical protein